jgi:hypothetical protein
MIYSVSRLAEKTILLVAQFFFTFFKIKRLDFKHFFKFN